MRAFFKLISYIFHPLFIPVYMTVAVFSFPVLDMARINLYGRIVILALLLINNVLVPLFAMRTLKVQGKIQSYEMPGAAERQTPYIITFLLYAFTSWMFLKSSFVNPALKMIPLSAAIMVFFIFWINKKIKISAHTAAMGSAFAYFLLMRFYYDYNTLVYLTLIMLITGFVGSARLFLQAHNEKEIYTGFGLGFVTMLTLGCCYLFYYN